MSVDTARSSPAGRTGKEVRHRPERTCVGCGQSVDPSTLVRVVASPDGEVAVDLAGGRFGRGAYVHASARCIGAAPRGLSKAFRCPIKLRPDDLATAIAQAVEKRMWGLLASAARSRRVAIGADPVVESLESDRAELVVVARDAAAAASLGPVMRAIAQGRSIAFGTKAELGALFARPEVGVITLTSARLAAAVRQTVMVGSGIHPVRRDAETQTVQASQSATMAEDR